VITNPIDSRRLAQVVQDHGLTFEEKHRIRQASLEVDSFDQLPSDLRARIIEIENGSSAAQGSLVDDTRRLLLPLVDRAWALQAAALGEPDTAVVQPSMPILYFGDYGSYASSPMRIVTVGLNPSLAEFPAADPWSRFPAAAALEGPASLGEGQHASYLAALDEYFVTAPYRAWFDRSFERILNGADASYYPGAACTAIHTDIASPVATDPTWSSLGARQAHHRGGAELWRDLISSLAPDIIIVSVARHHLYALTPLAVTEWPELTRVERDNPFVVAQTTVTIGASTALVVFGRCTNLPFGSVGGKDREPIGAAIRSRLEALRREGIA
jgi:hypothetical protein